MTIFRLGRGGLAVAFAFVVAATGLHAQALQKPTSAQARMLDARVNLKSAYTNALAARPGPASNAYNAAKQRSAVSRDAFASMHRAVPGLAARYSSLTGVPTALVNNAGWLTNTRTSASSESVVRQYLANRADVFGLSAQDQADIVVLGDSAGGSKGLRMLRVEQQIDGVPVFQSESRFLLAADGRISKYVGQIVPDARAAVSPGAWGAPGDAVANLLAFEGRSIDPDGFAVSQDGNGRTLLRQADDYVAGDVTARQVLFPISPGMLVQAWSLVVFTSGDADWYAVVDAMTGDVLWRKNIRAEASTHDARFRVYTQADGVTPADSPAPLSPTNVTPGSGTQPSEIAPTIVSMHTAYNASASPNGWIDDCPAGGCTANQTQTLGNNVLACLDRTVGGTNTNVCDTDAASVLDGNGRPTGNPDANGRNRDFLGTTPRDFQTSFLPPPQGGNPEAGQTATGAGNNGTLPIDQFRRGAVTNLFYVVNWYHDRLFALGFDEASGNFQQTNFSGMGLGGDRIAADAQDGSGTNNSNFATPPDGTSGRMQMYRFTGPTIDRDGDLDGDVMLHELTHGTSNRLVGNGAGLNWDPAGGMGEGWSDFYALSLLNGTNADNPNGSYAFGAYVTYKLSSGFVDNYVYGIRRFPYSTDHSQNPLTWADVDDVTNDMSGGIAQSPLNINNNGGMEVHNIGEIWALTLWGVRARIIADPAGANGDVPSGNNTMLQLVTDGLKHTPIDPSFTDARDALFEADCATNACANETSIWAGFADRGLGYGSQTPYNVDLALAASHMALRESFQSPFLDVVDPATDVAIDDSASNNNGAIDPGEAVKLTVSLTNPWRAASRAVTSATATLTSSTPGVTIYNGTATYGAIAPQGHVAGTPFLITVDPSVQCGTTLSFTLVTVSNLGTTFTTFTRRVGAANGTDPVITYTRTPASPLAIPDAAPRGVFDSTSITDDFEISNLQLRMDSVTHTFTGDLTFMLRSPGGVGVDSISLIGGLTDGGSGDNITGMIIDDASTQDMVEAVAADAPFTGSWQPVFNAAWPALAGYPGPDPVGTFSRYNGTSTKGTWTMLASDESAADTGTLNSWSVLVTPTHFDCTAFTPSVAITASNAVTGSFRVGGTVTYTITLTNNGTANQADNAGHEFTDTFPASLAVTGATATSGTPVASGNTVNWDGSLAPLGGSVTITVTASINAGAQGTAISDQGTVSFDGDANGTNESTLPTDDPTVGGTADPTVLFVDDAQLAASMTVAGSFAVGGTVTYTVTLHNGGTANQTDNPGNEFTDVLPSSLTLVSAAASSGTPVANTGTNTVTWNGAVAAGADVTITITATVNTGTQGTTISNQGTLNYDADLNGSNESTAQTDDPAVAGASDPTVFTVGAAQVSATMSVSGSFTVGGTVTYTVTLHNTGGSATADNPGDEFIDTLPASLTLGSVTASSGTPGSAGNTTNWNGAIAAGGSVTITIVAHVNASAAGTTVSNQGTVHYDADVNGSNESTALTDDPAVAGATDPTQFSVAAAPPVPAVAVPSLSPWMLVLLAIGLGIVAMPRRRTR